jgi:presenilin 1
MSEWEIVLEFLSRRVTKLLIPVLLTLIFDGVLSRLLNHHSGDARILLAHFPLPFHNSSIQESVSFALTLIAAILVGTALLVVLYFLNCLSAIIFSLKIGFAAIITITIYSHIGDVASFLNAPLDRFSVFLLIANFAVVGTLAIFWRAPLIFTQFFLMLISIFTTLLFIEFPDWTFWTLLLLLVVYDVFSLLPNGLMRLFVEKAQERGDSIPGLLYSTAAHMADDYSEETLFDDDDGGQALHDEVLLQEAPHAGARRHDPGLVLGLGDFIFYGALVTRAARVGWDVFILSAIGVVLGLCVTLGCLMVKQRPLPALPFSLSAGALFFFAGIFTFRPFSRILIHALCVF